MNKKNILVFPCGSEIALEIYRSVRYCQHFKLIGANGIDDHGKFIFEDYIGGVPFVDNPKFIPSMEKIVKEHKIDAIYPATDLAVAILKSHEKEMGCLVVAPPVETCEICLSKIRTHENLHELIPAPQIFFEGPDLPFPVFVKPNLGHSGRGTKLINSFEELNEYKVNQRDFTLYEYLPGDEYTADCFTDRHRKLRFCQPRRRARIANGISVNTYVVDLPNATQYANKISSALNMRGAWFYQMKQDANGNPKLMEVAARFGGSSVLCRARGVNMALLSLYDAFGIDVEIMTNDYDVELDRALENVYKLNLSYDSVFLDYDDCLIINNELNPEMMSFLTKCKNEKKSINIISRHDGDLDAKLRQWGIFGFFNSVIHITDKIPKSKYISGKSPIFIEDSFAERKEVMETLKIPVFSPDMVECLSKGFAR
jgi:hypothetical protein